MSQNRNTPVVFVTFVVLFAALLLIVLFTAVSKTSADVIRPSVDRRLISVGAANVTYDSTVGLIAVQDDTAAFTFQHDETSQFHLIYNLSGGFGGSYLLSAGFVSTAANAPLDGLFGTAGLDLSDLIISGEIPSMNITVNNGYTGTLLEANVVSAEFFGFATSNSSAELNLLLEVVGGDLVTAGEYAVGQHIGELSSVFTLSPSLPAGFGFDSDFAAELQSGTIGVPIPEPATLGLFGLGMLGAGALRRFSRRRRVL